MQEGFNKKNIILSTILVTGANGQLGSELKQLESKYSNFDFLFLDREDLDITDEAAVKFFFEENEIGYCINAAAYTAVDNAEKDKENAYILNALAVKYLAENAMKNNCKFIQISTDFVFDGKVTSPLKETDLTNPLSVYGQTKLEGEKFALENQALVIRTSWLYSTFGNNFVKTMLRLGAERESLNIIADQIGTPTYAKDLAEVLMFLVSKVEKEKLTGLYHFSNDGVASWYDFAAEIFRISGTKCTANPIPTEQYPTPAERPKYSLMDKTKISRDFGVVLKGWKTSLAECIEALDK